MKNLFSNRCFSTLVLACFLVFFTGSHRPRLMHPLKKKKLEQERFWIEKTHGASKYDMVFVGDSRLCRSLAPEIIRKTFPEKQILNFGFTGSNLNEDFLKAAYQRLDKKKSQKIIVIACSSFALSEVEEKKTKFYQESIKSADKVFLHTKGRALYDFFVPITPGEILRSLKGKTFEESYPQLLKEDYRSDGWIAVTLPGKFYRKPDQQRIQQFISSLDNGHNKLSSELFENLKKTIQRWRKEQIAVFFMRIPTSPELYSFENELYHIDFKALQKQVESAGAQWIPTKNEAYRYYDGNHMDRKSAIAFSKKIAEQLKRSLSDVSLFTH
jgi:hypothetical protein